MYRVTMNGYHCEDYGLLQEAICETLKVWHEDAEVSRVCVVTDMDTDYPICIMSSPASPDLRCNVHVCLLGDKPEVQVWWVHYLLNDDETYKDTVVRRVDKPGVPSGWEEVGV